MHSVFTQVSSVRQLTKVRGQSEDVYVKVCNVQGSAAVAISQFQGPTGGRSKAGPNAVLYTWWSLLRTLFQVNRLLKGSSNLHNGGWKD